MALIFNRRSREGPSQERTLMVNTSNLAGLIPRRVAGASGLSVRTEQEAMHISAVWSAVRLRADLLSTMPFSCLRNVQIDDFGSVRIDAPPGPFIGDERGFMSFRYVSQVALDTGGNAIGIIQQKDSQGYPTKIEMAPNSAVDVLMNGRQLRGYRIWGTVYPPDRVWHEKQFEFPGLHVGLSPVEYAAYQLGQYANVQQFAQEWFTSGQGPRASLKNTEREIDADEALRTKEAWRASQSMGEPFVHGSNWEYSLIKAEQASADWLESQKLSKQDLAQFFGVPADLIDAALTSGQSLTYANMTQRNLQFLVMHLGPAIRRREVALSQLLPKPRFVDFDTDSLLRMDPATRAEFIKTRIQARTLSPSEARALDNLPPFTEAQIKEFEILGLNGNATSYLTAATGIPVADGTQPQPAPSRPVPSS